MLMVLALFGVGCRRCELTCLVYNSDLVVSVGFCLRGGYRFRVGDLLIFRRFCAVD